MSYSWGVPREPWPERETLLRRSLHWLRSSVNQQRSTSVDPEVSDSVDTEQKRVELSTKCYSNAMTATLIGTPDPDARRPGWTATNTEGHVRVYEDGRISTPQTRARAWDRLPAPPPDEIW